MPNAYPDLDRRDFMRRTAGTAAALAAGLPAAACATQPGGQRGPAGAGRKRPNLLFVFSDQQSWDMLGCYGNTDILTPRTDAFAKEGLRFTHCFSNAPVCTPYRGMLMSGKHPLHNGALENDTPLCPSAGPHFGEVLESAGYRTGYIGKWHLLGGDRARPVPQGPLRAGFDATFYSDNCTTEFRAGHAFYYDDQGRKQVYDQWQPYGQTDQAMDFLDDAAAADDPFALFVSWHPPHDHGRLPAPPDPHYNYRHYPPELREGYGDRHLALRPGVADSPERQAQLRDYYAMCSGIDVAFGRLLDRLAALNLDENTIVVFTSDHGDMLGSFDAPRPKRPPHDTSARVPLLIRQPGVLPADLTSDLLISGLDMMPTLLGLMDLTPPDGVHGQNLAAPIRTGDDDAVQSIPMLMIAWPVFRGVITKEWTFGMGKPGEQNAFNSVLFDRTNDPHQQTNLFDDPAADAAHAEMEALTRTWMDRFEDPFITIQDLARIQPWESWREPPGDPAEWPTPIDVFHGRARPLVPLGGGDAASAAPVVAGWRAHKQAQLTETDAGLLVRATGSDPILGPDAVDVGGHRGPLVVELRIRCAAGGDAQVFWSTGGPFSAKQAAEQELTADPGFRDYRIALPVEGVLRSLRFDPLRGPGELTLARVVLLTPGGEVLQRWDFTNPPSSVSPSR